MLSLKVLEADRILVVEAAGMMSESDIDGAMDALQKEYPSVGVRIRGEATGGYSMLLDWQALEGWQTGAKTFGTISARTIGNAARKIAIVADEKFQDERERIEDAAPGAAVRFFATGRFDDALAWLREH